MNPGTARRRGFVYPRATAGINMHTDSATSHEVQSNTRSWNEFAQLITAAWRKPAVAFIDTALLIREAKAELPRDEYDALIQLKLPFDKSVARKLLRIAGNPILCAPGHTAKLPPCWTIIYDLSKLADEILTAALADGRIHPKMQRKDVRDLRGVPPPSPRAPKPTVAPAAWWRQAPIEARQNFLEEIGGIPELLRSMPPDMHADLRHRVGGPMVNALPVKSRAAARKALGKKPAPSKQIDIEIPAIPRREPPRLATADGAGPAS